MKTSLLGFVAACSLTVSGGAIAATIGEVARSTVTTVYPGAIGTFAGASFSYANTITLNTTPGTLLNAVSIRPGAVGISFGGLNGVNTDVSSAPNGTTTQNVKITSAGLSGSAWRFGFNGTASATPGQTFLTQSFVAGHHVLSFNGGGLNFVDSGGTFTSDVKILGDWSESAVHTAPTFGAGYAILSNFAFDSTYTDFTVQTTNYNGTNPSISFDLEERLATVIPAPASLPLMLTGVIGLMAARSRRPAVRG